MTSTRALDPIPDDVRELVETIGEDIFGRHERGWVMWPLISKVGMPPYEIVERAIMADRARRAALPTEASVPADMREQFWVAPTLSFQRGPREWHDDIDEACERAAQYSRETGHNYEVYQRVAFVTPTTLKLIRAEHRP